MSSSDFLRIFTFGRDVPFPAIYKENKTAVTVDVLEVGWIIAFFTGYICFLILLPASVGSEKTCYFLRMTLTTFIGITVILCNFGQEWEVGELTSEMFYKAGSHQEIHGKVGIKLGLRAVNITLFADSNSLQGDLSDEKIDYNERFEWTWDQGRAGFGPYAGRIQREFREAQLKGIPYPILWIAEYFTFDGEGLRFGRHYRHAGWYAHICMWCAFVCWILTVIFFKFYIRFGAVMLSILGCFKVFAALIWCFNRNFIELAIVFHNEKDGILRTRYGVHWYLALLVGIFCVLSGILIYAADLFFHNELCKFFAVDPYGIIDEIYADNQIEIAPASNEIEMEEKEHFKGRRQKTVVYHARGTKKSWRKNETVESVVDNAEYFDVTNNPTVDPNYLDVGYQNESYYSNQAMTSQAYYDPSDASYYNPNAETYDDGEAYYQDTNVQPHQYNVQQIGHIIHQHQQQQRPTPHYPAQEQSLNPLPLPQKRRLNLDENEKKTFNYLMILKYLSKIIYL